MVRQVLRRVSGLQSGEDVDEFEEASRPAVKEYNRNCIGLLREESYEVYHE